MAHVSGSSSPRHSYQVQQRYFQTWASRQPAASGPLSAGRKVGAVAPPTAARASTGMGGVFSEQGELSKRLSLCKIQQIVPVHELSSSFNLSALSRRPEGPRRARTVPPPRLWVHLAVVACGSRLEETLVVLKSAVLLSHRRMQFHIFAEESLQPELDEQVNLQKS